MSPFKSVQYILFVHEGVSVCWAHESRAGPAWDGAHTWERWPRCHLPPSLPNIKPNHQTWVLNSNIPKPQWINDLSPAWTLVYDKIFCWFCGRWDHWCLSHCPCRVSSGLKTFYPDCPRSWCPGLSAADISIPARPRHGEWRQDLQQISAAGRVTCNFQTYLPRLSPCKICEKYIFTNLTNILRISFKLFLHNFPLSGCWVQNLAIYAATSGPCRTQPSSRRIKDNNPVFSLTYHNI